MKREVEVEKAMVAVYRILLLISTGISFLITYGDLNLANQAFFQQLFQVQWLMVAGVLLIVLLDVILNRSLSGRLLCGILYVVTALWSSEIVLHEANHHLFWQNSFIQISWFIAEVILMAILLRNEFTKRVIA